MGNKGPRRGPGAQNIVETPNDFKGAWVKVINYSKKYRLFIIMALIFSVMGSILTLIGPDMLSELTDLITKGFMTGIDMDAVKEIGITLAVIYLVGYLLSVLQGVIMATITQKITNKLRSDISLKIDRLPMGYFSKVSTGDVLSRITNDVDMVSQSLNMSVGMLVSAITLFLGSLIMMFYTNIILTIAAILSTIIGFVLMSIIMKKSQKYFKEQQENLGNLNGHIEEMYSAHTIVKAYSGEDDSINTFNDLNNKLKNSAFRAQSLSGLMMPIMMFIGNFGYVVVCIVGALLVFDNKISFGVIVAFMMYIRYFTNPLSQIAQGMQQLQSAAASIERVFKFLEEKEMLDESNKKSFKKDVVGNIEFKNVSFGYSKDKQIIKDFSFKVKKGEKVAIVGPTGAGKTTIINLLMRFYDIDSGEIYIDKIPTSSMKREDVHNKFCMVLQDTWLFEGTIYENLVYGNNEITIEEVKDACKKTGIHHFIKTLKDGYNTVLSDSVTLSIGQKQMLTIARAMLANKPMLILDEATSSVDTRTEVEIQKAMDHLMEGRTSFVIAHRLSTIKNADIILVMKDGSIIESGNHDTLIKQGGFYNELYNSQFDDKE